MDKKPYFEDTGIEQKKKKEKKKECKKKKKKESGKRSVCVSVYV